MTGPWQSSLTSAQEEVERTREEHRQAIDARASVVTAAHASGVTIYAIAKHLGVTQNAVRGMLKLPR